MRSFTIDEPGSSVRALYATLEGCLKTIMILMSDTAMMPKLMMMIMIMMIEIEIANLKVT